MQSGSVVVMAVGDDNEVQRFQVNFQRLHVVGEVLASSAGVKKYASPGIFDERGISPSSFQIRLLTESIVQNCNARRLSLRKGTRCK